MTKTSPLYDLHRLQGAAFIERDGWLLADRFGDISAEYDAIRSGAGIIDLCDQTMLQFTGPDRLSYLQGMLTHDLRPLRMFEGQQAAILTQQGKIVALTRVLCAMNSFYLDFFEPLKAKVLEHLNRYLVADDVEIHDPNEQWKMLSVQGPKAESVLRQVFVHGDFPTKADHHAMVRYSEEPVCIVRVHRTVYGGYDIIVKDTLIGAVTQRLRELGASSIGDAAYDVLRIEAGLPRYGIDYSTENLFLELDLANAVSFSKGCYLGQEIVERIRSRGHVNKKLCGLLVVGLESVKIGDRLNAGDKEVGYITSTAYSFALHRFVALGYVNKEHWTSGTELTASHSGHEISLAVTARPIISIVPNGS